MSLWSLPGGSIQRPGREVDIMRVGCVYLTHMNRTSTKHDLVGHLPSAIRLGREETGDHTLAFSARFTCAGNHVFTSGCLFCPLN